MYEMDTRPKHIPRFNFEIEEDPHVNFGICIKQSERDWLKDYAKRRGVSMAQLFRDFLEELKEEEKDA